MPPARIGVFGANGRMGKSVVGILEDDYRTQAEVSARIDRTKGRLDDLKTVDAIIDFSLPEGTETLLDWLSGQSGRLPVYVCGTTGLNDKQHSKIAEVSRSTVVFYATNFSPGVAALSEILRVAAPILNALEYKPRITETHHVHKQDAPSGTANTLSEIIDAEDPAAIDITSVREGEVVGEHTVTFSGVADQITIAHEAADRSLFARGAVDAAIWLVQRGEKNGLYSMESYFRDRYLVAVK
jgi:4-hydroxy-tetrahydrodipicolinate reductase